MNKDLKRILEYLNEKRGFDFSGYRSSFITSLVRQRCADARRKDYGEYFHYIKGHADEIDKLVDALTINVSRFFRNTLTFDHIAKNLLPLVFSGKIRTCDYSLRVWSAACSTGEEAYSIAILINEVLEKETLGFNVNVFATDIDKRALRKAQEAVYAFEDLEDVKYGLLKKYFTKEDESFRLVSEIKNMVTFAFYDVLDQRSYVPPESVFGDFDMVFCCNLLIYYNIEYQNLIFNKLYRSLAPNGYLVLGGVERPPEKYQKYFKKVYGCCNIYQKQ
jgi:chemotaxis protein methyltransferase CheR